MIDANIAQARAQVLATLRSNEECLVHDLQSFDGVLLGMGYVVVTGSEDLVPLKFDISPEGKVSNPRPCMVAKFATRFDIEDATRLAAEVTNGNGEHGVAMHVTTAIARKLASVRKCIAEIESL